MDQSFIEKTARTPAQKQSDQTTENHHPPARKPVGRIEQPKIEQDTD
jgi:hypothetical protein